MRFDCVLVLISRKESWSSAESAEARAEEADRGGAGTTVRTGRNDPQGAEALPTWRHQQTGPRS